MSVRRRFGLVCLVRQDHIALVLAAFQAADLAVTTISPSYGDEHLESLGFHDVCDEPASVV